MPKTVCIVGAGPSGLVAAKSLLHDVPSGTYDVTIFDTQSRIGGLWPSQRDDNDGLVHPLMVANQSKHTVQFSDLAWEDGSPQLPRAWQVGRYLHRYFQTYCQGVKLCLRTRVESADPPSAAGSGWKVQTRSWEGVATEQVFDYLLIAASFFGQPVIPAEICDKATVPVIHSSKYRSLPGLLGGSQSKGGKILVVGGQMSGVEIAGTIATHISAVTHSPGVPPIANPDKYTVHHIVPRPVWVFPLYTSPKPSSSTPPFLPLDLGSYNLSNRSHPLTNTQGHISTEAARTVHGIYQNVVGGDQSSFSPAVAVSRNESNNPAYLAVSDHYLDFVRSGLISVSRGKLGSITENVATVLPSGEEIGSIAAVSIRETLSVREADLINTVALAFHNTHHPQVPNLGFVGFYRSPYWGVMEMQARFLATLWTHGGFGSPSLPEAMRHALTNDSSIERTLNLRTDPRASQFPMGDYAWLMQEFASALELERSPPLSPMPRLPPEDMEMDILTPARYPSKSLTERQQSEVRECLRQTESTAWAGLSSARFLAKAVFRSLLGEWKLERDLTSRLPSHPSGHFSGTAKFFLREGTREGREAEFDELGDDGGPGMEYLYVEEGDFKASNGLTFRATRRYVWRYNEENDKLSVWFVKTDDQKKADYLFHEVEFTVPEGEDDGKGWRATAGHLCIDDFYNVNYEFLFEAINLRSWRLTYTVNGPKKDYTIDGKYKR